MLRMCFSILTTGSKWSQILCSKKIAHRSALLPSLLFVVMYVVFISAWRVASRYKQWDFYHQISFYHSLSTQIFRPSTGFGDAKTPDNFARYAIIIWTIILTIPPRLHSTAKLVKIYIVGDFNLHKYSLQSFMIQVNLFQKPSFLHQLTHNMTRDCSLNSRKNASSQNVAYKNCFFVFVLTFKTIFVHNMLWTCIFRGIQWTISRHIVG